jgi:outer membrane protein
MKHIFFYIILFFCFYSETFAQETTNETLNQLVRAAIDYAPRIKEQQQTVLMSDFRTKIQEAALKPQISTDISVTRIDPVAKAQFSFGPSPTSLQFQPNMNYNVNIGGNYVIYDWGKQFANIEKMRLETNLAKTNVESLKTVYAYQVANLYYGIVYNLKAIDVQQEQLKLVDDNGKIISNRLKQGDALEFDQVSVQVRYKNAESRLTDIQTQLERQYIYLSSLIGKDAHGIIPTGTSFNLGTADLSVEGALNQAQTNNFELKALKDRDLIAASDVRIAQMSALPNLAATAQVGVKNGYVPRINGEQPDFSDDFKLNSIVGVRLTIPVYTGHRGAYQTEVAKLNREMLKYSVDITNQGLKRDLEAAQNDYNSAKSKLDLSESNVKQAQYALKLANVRYLNGVSTNIEIETAQTALRDAQFTQLQYQYQMALAKLEMNRLSGVKFW